MPATVGIIADVKSFQGLPYHCAGEKYISACARFANAIPLVIPSCIDAVTVDIAAVFDRLDGILLPGSHSHINPQRYSNTPLSDDSDSLDLQRDGLSLAAIETAMATGLPVLGICRGLQEINVALGGTLEPCLHQRDDRVDHREPNVALPEQRYTGAHKIVPETGGIIDRLSGGQSQTVNSLHAQGIEALGDGLRVEARATDGLVEAVSLCHGDSWLLGVQWHCEFKPETNPFYRAIFAEFGARLAERHRHRALDK